MSTTTQTTVHALPAGTWTSDPVHSEVAFSVDYMAGTFHGTFSKFDVLVTDVRLEGTVDVSSIQVKDPDLEAHLQTPDFFDAQRSPQLRFVSKDGKRSGNQIEISGEITIKAETKAIELKGTISDPAADPFGNERFGLKLQGKIDRTSFGVSWNNPLPSGEPALANDVTLIAELQFVKAG